MNTDAFSLIDSHCHLHFPPLVDHLDDHLNDMTKHHVTAALLVATSPDELDSIRAIARHARLQKNNSSPMIYASLGIHPLNQYHGTYESLLDACAASDIIAVGETGLDYYRPEQTDRTDQQKNFLMHIDIARQTNKPLIVHTRDSMDDALDILIEQRSEKVIMHCFTGTLPQAKRALDAGFYISFSGIVTFKNATQLQQVAQAVPLERLLIETDAPYLAPTPHRGKTNSPAYVYYVAEKLSQLRGDSIEQLAQATGDNFLTLCNLQSES